MVWVSGALSIVLIILISVATATQVPGALGCKPVSGHRAGGGIEPYGPDTDEPYDWYIQRLIIVANNDCTNDVRELYVGWTVCNRGADRGNQRVPFVMILSLIPGPDPVSPGMVVQREASGGLAGKGDRPELSETNTGELNPPLPNWCTEREFPLTVERGRYVFRLDVVIACAANNPVTCTDEPMFCDSLNPQICAYDPPRGSTQWFRMDLISR